jgi:probable rRNA maturation factor
MRKQTERAAAPPAASVKPRLKQAKSRPGQLRVRSQGRREPLPGGSGRGVHAADGLGNGPGIVRVGGKTAGAARALPRRLSATSVLRVELQFVSRRPWVPGPVVLRRWARAAHEQGIAALPARRRRLHALVEHEATLCVRIVGSAESRRLNREYRGKDKPTNVLSFPSSPEERVATGALGDLVICAPVVAREAREQRKTLGAHWAHMAVHGTLHLLAFDHEKARDARVMEALEVEILRGLGFHDPYRRVTEQAI